MYFKTDMCIIPEQFNAYTDKRVRRDINNYKYNKMNINNLKRRNKRQTSCYSI